MSIVFVGNLSIMVWQLLEKCFSHILTLGVVLSAELKHFDKKSSELWPFNENPLTYGPLLNIH